MPLLPRLLKILVFIIIPAGLTLSGGEPLAQPDFAIEILEGAKKYNIHTCVETSGFVNKNLILKTYTVYRYVFI